MAAPWLLAASAALSLDLVRSVGPDARFDPDDWSELGRGGVVAKVVDTTDRAEVATASVVHVRATRQRFLACVRDPGCLRASDDLSEAGRLDPSPTAADLRQLILHPRDVGALRRCRVGRCDVRLSAEAISRFRDDVNWAAPSHVQEAEVVLRQLLARYAAGYLQRGDAALMRYEDSPATASVGDGTRLLLGRLSAALGVMPGLLEYVSGFPAPRPTGTEDFLYWYQERFWRKTVVALNHVVIADEGEAAGRVFVFTKQIYATHYFESSLELLVFEPGVEDGHGRIVHLARSRAQIRPGGFNGVERFLIRRLVRGRLTRQLEAMRDTLESERAAATRP